MIKKRELHITFSTLDDLSEKLKKAILSSEPQKLIPQMSFESFEAFLSWMFPNRFRILTFVHAKNPKTFDDLANLMKVEKDFVIKLCNSLESLGFLRRAPALRNKLFTQLWYQEIIVHHENTSQTFTFDHKVDGKSDPTFINFIDEGIDNITYSAESIGWSGAIVRSSGSDSEIIGLLIGSNDFIKKMVNGKIAKSQIQFAPNGMKPPSALNKFCPSEVIRYGRYGQTSISWDEDHSELVPLKVAEILYIPDTERSEHEHIKFNATEAQKLYNWLGRFLKGLREVELKD